MKYKVSKGKLTEIEVGLNFGEYIETYRLLSVGVIISLFFLGLLLEIVGNNQVLMWTIVALMAILIGGYIIHYRKKAHSKITINSEQKWMKINGEDVEINPSTEVMLIRAARLPTNRDARRPGSLIQLGTSGIAEINTYRLNENQYQETDKVINQWIVGLRNNDQILEIIKTQAGLIGTSYYASRFNEIAETIVEELDLTLVDFTGEEEIIIPPGQTDVSLMEKLQKQSDKYDAINEASFNDVKEILDVTIKNGIYDIRFPDRQRLYYQFNRVIIGLVIFLGFGIIDFFLFRLVFDSFIAGEIVAGIVLGIFAIGLLIPIIVGFLLFDSQFATDILLISNEDLRFMTHNLITKSTNSRVPIDEIERIIIYKLGNSHGVEIVTERERIPVSENLTQKQAEQVKLAFEDALYEFGRNRK